MRNAIASKIIHSQTEIGHLLARRGVELLLSVDEGCVLLQCQVSSAVAAAMLAPLGGAAIGQFRSLSANVVEIDAAVTMQMAGRMLQARDSALAASSRLH